ncbi:MAG: LysR family transcriptional regulator [Rhizobiaceae bacterium]
MPDLDWNLIRSFAAVAETGSLSAAARKLSASQPTIGRHVAELEAALGVVLFRRGPRGYELTDRGATLFDRAAAVGVEAAAFERLATGAAENSAGTVRITASDVISTYVLPALVASLAIREPAVEVELVPTNRVENLLGRDADIAIRMVAPAQQELVARKIADLALTACAATTYLDRRGRPARAEDLAAHDLVGYDRDPALIQGYAAFGVAVDRHAFRFRTDNQIVFWEAVRAGVGIGFGQSALVARDPLIEPLLPDLPLPKLPMWLAMHRDVRTSARIRLVADFLAAELKTYAAG